MTDGLRLAREEPTLREAAWALMLEVGDTQRRLVVAGGGQQPEAGHDRAIRLGLPVVTLRRHLGCGRRTTYDVCDRGIACICDWLRQRSAVAAAWGDGGRQLAWRCFSR